MHDERDPSLEHVPRAMGASAEARALALLEHPHVVRILHADRDQRVGFFIVMELLEGRDLRRIMLGLSAGKGSVPVDRACGIALQIADALSAFHRVGVMHRDLKPENIFVSSSSEGHSVKLLDLGLAKLGGQESGEVSLHGTVQYMAPEQLHGERASHRTEVFALGVVLYELLAGVHPFPPAPGFKSRGVAAHVGMDRAMYAPLTDSRPDIPRALDGFVRRVLSRKPEARPGSMQEFRAELARALREGPIEDANPDATAPLVSRPSGPDPDATSPLGHPAADHAPTSGADAPQTDLGPTIRMRIELGPVATVELAALELLGKPPEERVLPPFACALRSELATPSLVLVEGPGAWRFMRIPVLSVPGRGAPPRRRWGSAPASPSRGSLVSPFGPEVIACSWRAPSRRSNRGAS